MDAFFSRLASCLLPSPSLFSLLVLSSLHSYQGCLFPFPTPRYPRGWFTLFPLSSLPLLLMSLFVLPCLLPTVSFYLSSPLLLHYFSLAHDPAFSLLNPHSCIFLVSSHTVKIMSTRVPSSFVRSFSPSVDVKWVGRSPNTRKDPDWRSVAIIILGFLCPLFFSRA